MLENPLRAPNTALTCLIWRIRVRSVFEVSQKEITHLARSVPLL